MITKPASIIAQQFKRLQATVIWFFVVLALAQLAVFVLLISYLWGESIRFWLPEWLIATAALVVGALGTLIVINRNRTKMQQRTIQAIARELQPLNKAYSQLEMLQAMASTINTSLGVERVMEAALEISLLSLADMGPHGETSIGAIYIIEGEELAPLVARGLSDIDREVPLRGQQGVIGKALKQAEPALSRQPGKDPELKTIPAFAECREVICLPLRSGFQIYGAIILGQSQVFDFQERDLAVLAAIADQAAISMQNAQLVEELITERRKIMTAEEVERQALRDSVHDGLAQQVAAVAMRIALIRSLMIRDPDQAQLEMAKVEKSAREASREIRDILFVLRPMELDGRHLGEAVERAIGEIGKTDGLTARYTGTQYGKLLDDEAQRVVYFVIQEALRNIEQHAQAHQVEVRLWQENNWFAAQVKDDGVGYDAQATRDGHTLGMTTMQERIARLDGSFHVVSRAGLGTTVTLLIPLEKHGRRSGTA